MATEFDGKHGAFLAIPFQIVNATTQESNTDLQCFGAGAVNWCAPGAGFVVGISATCDAITAGTITLSAHKASTEVTESGAPAPVLSSAQDTNGTFATIREGAISFAAGDTLGISATSTTTLNPTNTVDVAAILYVVLKP